jgi:hypothetical protein
VNFNELCNAVDAQSGRIIETHRWAVRDNGITMRRLDGWAASYRRRRYEMAYHNENGVLTWTPRVIIDAIAVPVMPIGWTWLIKVEAAVIHAEHLGLRNAGEDWVWSSGDEIQLDGRRLYAASIVHIYDVMELGHDGFRAAYRNALG